MLLIMPSQKIYAQEKPLTPEQKARLHKYITACEKIEYEVYETQLTLAQCLKDCNVEWYQTKTAISAVIITSLISGILMGVNSK